MLPIAFDTQHESPVTAKCSAFSSTSHCALTTRICSLYDRNFNPIPFPMVVSRGHSQCAGFSSGSKLFQIKMALAFNVAATSFCPPLAVPRLSPYISSQSSPPKMSDHVRYLLNVTLSSIRSEP